jgi:hypothetical protein
MFEKRKSLYTWLVQNDYIENTLYPAWVGKNFASEADVVKLFNAMVKLDLFTKDVNTFFDKFACDLFPSSQYCQGTTQQPSSGQQQSTTQDTSEDNGTFSCVMNSTLLKPLEKTIKDHDSVSFKLKTGGELQFYANKSFIYVSHLDSNKKVNGTWGCNGTGDFIVNTNNNARLDSKKGSWDYDVVAKSSTEQTGVSGNVKIGDKGTKVEEVQNLLIQNGYKNISKDGTVDGIFGQRTISAVKDFQSANKDSQGNPLRVDGIVGPATMEALSRKKLQENFIKLIVDRNLKRISN